MGNRDPLTELEVIELAHKWYAMLNTHAPLAEFLPLLASEGLVMKFPEDTLEGIDAFKEWHKTVTHQFFDQDHNIKFMETELEGNGAKVRIIVRWQARSWEPPVAKSTWLGYDAYQSWRVERSPESGKAVIKAYSVDAFMPLEGSA